MSRAMVARSLRPVSVAVWCLVALAAPCVDGARLLQERAEHRWVPEGTLPDTARDVARSPGEVAGAGGSLLRSWNETLPKELAQHIVGLLRFRVVVAASGCHNSVTLWGLDGHARSLTGHRSAVLGMEFFPADGRALTWSSDGRVIVWDVRLGIAIQELVHRRSLTAARIFPMGDRVATRSEDGSLRVWSLRTFDVVTMIRRLPHGVAIGHGALDGLEVSPCGAWLLTWGHRSSVSLWDADTGASLGTIRGHIPATSAVRIFPTGSRIATAGMDKRACVWDAASRKRLAVMPHDSHVKCVEVMPGGGVVVTIATIGTAALWDASSGALLRKLWRSGSVAFHRCLGAAIFPQGDRMLTYSATQVIVWNISAGRPLRNFAMSPDYVRAVAVSPAGDFVAVCGADGELVVFSMSGQGMRGQRLVSPFRRASGPGRSRAPCFVRTAWGGALDHEGFGNEFGMWEIPRLVVGH